MRYLDGRDILLGDKVDLGGGMTGVVVGCIEEGEFADGFPKDKWGYLAKGVIVKSEQAGIIHYPKSDVDLVLIQRSTPK
jgi:hypothetical protein